MAASGIIVFFLVGKGGKQWSRELPHLGRGQCFLQGRLHPASPPPWCFTVATPASPPSSSSSVTNRIVSPLGFLISREENRENKSKYQFVIVTTVWAHCALSPPFEASGSNVYASKKKNPHWNQCVWCPGCRLGGRLHGLGGAQPLHPVWTGFHYWVVY